eukprot:g12455.t1
MIVSHDIHTSGKFSKLTVYIYNDTILSITQLQFRLLLKVFDGGVTLKRLELTTATRTRSHPAVATASGCFLLFAPPQLIPIATVHLRLLGRTWLSVAYGTIFLPPGHAVSVPRLPLTVKLSYCPQLPLDSVVGID